MGNVNMEASQINYRGGEKKMTVEEALKNTSGELDSLKNGLTDVSSKVPIRGDFTIACEAGINVFHRDTMTLVRGNIPTSAFSDCLFIISNHGVEVNCPNTIETDGNDIIINAKSAQNLRVTWLDMSNIPKYSGT